MSCSMCSGRDEGETHSAALAESLAEAIVLMVVGMGESDLLQYRCCMVWPIP